MNSNCLKVVALLLLATHSWAHLTFDPYALKLIRDKFEKKLDTNYFFYDKKDRMENSFECLAEDGPYCQYLNGKMIHQESFNNSEDYERMKATSYGSIIRQTAYSILSQLRSQTNKGSDMLFYENRREILDELIFPQYFNRYMQLIFTFETFKAEDVEKPADRTITYDIEAAHFNTYLHPSLNHDIVVEVKVANLTIAAKKSTFVLEAIKPVTKMFSSFTALTSDDELEKVRFGQHKPQGNYLFTKTDSSEGVLKYSHKVLFQYLFARLHSSEEVTMIREGEVVKKTVSKAQNIEGLLAGKSVFNLSVSREDSTAKSSQDGWYRRYPKEPVFIDELRIGSNIDIDNVHVWFDISKFEKESAEIAKQKLKDLTQKPVSPAGVDPSDPAIMEFLKKNGLGNAKVIKLDDLGKIKEELEKQINKADPNSKSSKQEAKKETSEDTTKGKQDSNSKTTNKADPQKEAPRKSVNKEDLENDLSKMRESLIQFFQILSQLNDKDAEYVQNMAEKLESYLKSADQGIEAQINAELFLFEEFAKNLQSQLDDNRLHKDQKKRFLKIVNNFKNTIQELKKVLLLLKKAKSEKEIEEISEEYILLKRLAWQKLMEDGL